MVNYSRGRDRWPDKWPDAVLNRLKALWSEGKSAAECADVLKKEFPVPNRKPEESEYAATKITRSSVLGKLNRMGIRKPKEEGRITKPKVAVAPKPKPKPKPKPVVVVAAPPPPPPPPSPPPPLTGADSWKPLATVKPVRLEDTSYKHCRWPVDVVGGGESHWCCGADKQEGSPYCQTHTKRAWQPVDPKRKRDLMRLARRA